MWCFFGKAIRACLCFQQKISLEGSNDAKKLSQYSNFKVYNLMCMFTPCLSKMWEIITTFSSWQRVVRAASQLRAWNFSFSFFPPNPLLRSTSYGFSVELFTENPRNGMNRNPMEERERITHHRGKARALYSLLTWKHNASNDCIVFDITSVFFFTPSTADDFRVSYGNRQVLLWNLKEVIREYVVVDALLKLFWKARRRIE